jgi:hypothetical protein
MAAQLPTVNEYWTVTTRTGKELAVVWGALHADAVTAAEADPKVMASSNRQGGYGLRRLSDIEARNRSLIA